MEHINPPAAALTLHTLADAVAAGTVPLPLMRYDQAEGFRIRIVPRALHNLLCAWRVATPQETDPVVISCAGCGLAYPPESVDPTGTTTGHAPAIKAVTAGE